MAPRTAGVIFSPGLAKERFLTSWPPGSSMPPTKSLRQGNDARKIQSLTRSPRVDSGRTGREARGRAQHRQPLGNGFIAHSDHNRSRYPASTVLGKAKASTTIETPSKTTV